MSERGKEIYRKSVANVEDKGRGHDTLAARTLMQDFIQPLAEALSEWANKSGPGMNGMFRPIIRTIDPHAAMYLALYALFDSFTFEANITTLAAKIGRMVEDELRFTNFQTNHGDYYNEIQQDFKRKGTKSYEHKHRVLTYKANEHKDGWDEWLPSERVGVGMKLIDVILTETDLIEKIDYTKNGKKHSRLQPTKSAQEWIDKHHELRELMFPDRMPCIIEPDEWTGLAQGGYYSPELRSITKLVKTGSKAHRKRVEQADLSRRSSRAISTRATPSTRAIMTAVNSVQRVPWSVNDKVLETIKIVWARNLRIGMPPKEPLKPEPSPFVGRDRTTLTPEEQDALDDWKHEAAEIYTQEKERIAKSFQVSRIMRMATEYQDKRFWYVWYCDFRGRMYTATAGFSPQGPDIAKGCLRFANGKPLGERGWYWLRVHMANRYGYDKVNYDDRVAWVEERRQVWLDVANDPLSYKEHWAGADKPWQMLAAIFEYAEAVEQEALGFPISEYVSHLPIGLDGSCNGLQNFSAMLRDEKGGKATNLVPGKVPADIYMTVADVCSGKLPPMLMDMTLNEDDAKNVRKWIEFQDKWGKGRMPRNVPKRPVMTLPYGATRQSCTKYIYEAIVKTEGKNKDEHVFRTGRFKASTFLTPILWESIGEVVVAARKAMDWLQKCAGVVAKTNSPLLWHTPDGFLVYQSIFEIEILRVRTQLAGDFRIRLANNTDQIDSRGMRQSVSPNFVHSMDATHLRETVRRCAELGITDVACIHDDYGTHACDTDILHRVIREAFVDMYGHNDPLQSFKDEQEAKGHTLPDVPEKGTLDINLVLDSPFFFG
ncbi:DNA-directed RNA polymerase protein [Rhizobium phage RHph_X3_9]|nr:DNA-directed RNA polymerase protein [Rhizobium phage RHph_X3_9]